MWMYTLLPKILNMSLTASIVIVLVLITRLLLKKVPKIFSYALWAVVLFRLVCPVSFSSEFSLIGLIHSPASSVNDGTYSILTYIPTDIVHAKASQVDLPVPDVSEIINDNLPQGEEQLAADPLEFPMAGAIMLWLFGIGGMLIYSAISLIRLRRKLVGAVRLRDNIYLADHIVTPFVIGVFRPKIYLPSTLPEEEQSYVILHEQTHIRRFDHIVKMLAFLALAVHWFNPLVWVAFVLAVKDMEMSCDEYVLKRMGSDIKGEYGASLLSLATGRHLINGSPLAFGEGNIKGRIKNVMNFKRPAAWVIVISVLLVAALSVGFAANGAVNASDPDGYKSLFRERFTEARKVGLHYTATNCWGRDAVPGFSSGDTEYYLCEHYKSKAELRTATEAVFTDNLVQGYYSKLDSEAFLERDGRLYIAPRYLYDYSVWQAGDKISFKDKTTDTFLWDTLTVTKTGNSIVSYTLDWYQTFPGDPLASSFTLVKGEDGIWRFDECFGEADNMLVAFVDDTLSEAEARALKSRIEQNPNVKYADFDTSEEAMEKIMDKCADKSLFENIDSSVFHDRYDIFLRDASLIEQTANEILHIEGIVRVNIMVSAGEHEQTTVLAAQSENGPFSASWERLRAYEAADISADESDKWQNRLREDVSGVNSYSVGGIYSKDFDINGEKDLIVLLNAAEGQTPEAYVCVYMNDDPIYMKTFGGTLTAFGFMQYPVCGDIDNDGYHEIVYNIFTGGNGGAGSSVKGILKYKDHMLVPMKLPGDNSESFSENNDVGYQVKVLFGSGENEYKAVCGGLGKTIVFQAQNTVNEDGSRFRTYITENEEVGANCRGYSAFAVVNRNGRDCLLAEEYLYGEAGISHNVGYATFLIEWDGNGNPYVTEFGMSDKSVRSTANPSSLLSMVPVPSADAPSAEGSERILYEIAGSVAYRAENGEEYIEVTYADPTKPRVIQIIVIASLNKHPQGVPDTFTLEPDYIRSADASDAEHITCGYRMSNRGIDSAVLIVNFEGSSSLKYENLFTDWLKVRDYEKFFAEELNTEVTAEEEEAAQEAALQYYSNKLLTLGKVNGASRIQNLEEYRSAIIPDKCKDVVIAFNVKLTNTPNNPPRMIVLTKEYGGDWEVINEGY